MTPYLPTPEQWLAYVSARLMPGEQEEALAADRERIAQWHGEGLDNAEIMRRLGDPGLVARSLEATYLTREEEARLRPLLGWSPWRVLLVCLSFLALSLVFEFWEHRSLSPWNLLVVAYGAAVTAAMFWLRRHVSPWVWASLGASPFALLFPLILLTSEIRDHETTPGETAVLFALLLLVTGLAYTFAPSRQKRERREQMGQSKP